MKVFLRNSLQFWPVRQRRPCVSAAFPCRELQHTHYSHAPQRLKLPQHIQLRIGICRLGEYRCRPAVNSPAAIRQ
jgi:hypothetical protein